MKIKKLSAIAVSAFFIVLSALTLFACTRRELPQEPIVDDETVDPPTFLTVDGKYVIDENGNAVYLRGINAGGLFVTEHWMTGFVYNSTPSNDFRSLTQSLVKLYGEEQTEKLWQQYRDNWWSEEDFKICADMGINCIRLPFTYMNVDFAAVRDNDYEDAGKAYDFSALDEFIDKAAEYGMYVILDLHGAYGSQNGQDHSGQIIGNAEDVTFYSDARMKNLTVQLWTALSRHYKDNAAVAGYDLLNEPGEKAGLTSERHFAAFDEIYKAIRSTGDKHIVIFESCWDAKDLPMPDEYGWENCMYSFHHYAESSLGTTAHGADWNKKLRAVNEKFKAIPLYMGEFTNYSSTEKWEYVLDLLNRSNWHWTSWTYKVWGNMPWGIINIRGDGADKVNVSTDDYDTISDKFKLLRTDSVAALRYMFGKTTASGENTLEALFREYATAPAGEHIEGGERILYTDDGWLTTTNAGDGSVKLTDDRNLSKPLRITYATGSNDLANLTVGGKTLYVTGLSDTPAVVCGQPQSADSALFYPVKAENGVAFVSYYSCKYVRLDENGVLVADAVRLADATVFIEEMQ